MKKHLKSIRQEHLQLAITVYQNNVFKLSLQKIARQHDIAKSTLRERINDSESSQIFHQQYQWLIFEQEKTLTDWILLMIFWDWLSRVNQIQFMTMKLLWSSQQNDDLNINWIQRFLQRHTKLTFVFSQALNKERAVTHNKELINDWFDLYTQVLEDYDLQSSDIYNMNEKDFVMRIASKCRVICFKEQLSTMTQDNNWEWVSLIKCVSSDEVILRAWFIFKDKMHLKVWFDALKNVEDVEKAKKSHITVSDNEWISNEINLDWLQKCFEPKSAKQ